LGIVVTKLNKRPGIFSVDIGDHGNELGFVRRLRNVAKVIAQGAGHGNGSEDRVVRPCDDVELGLPTASNACLSPTAAEDPAHPLARDGEKRIVQRSASMGWPRSNVLHNEFLVDGWTRNFGWLRMQFVSKHRVASNLEPRMRACNPN
jgi:hypothetical protein